MKNMRLVSVVATLLLIATSCGTVSTTRADETLPNTNTTASVLSSGTLAEITIGHPTSGTAQLIRLEGGKHVARLEEFSTISGPDVHVWVSESATLTNASLRSSGYTDLGLLRSTNGNLNYDIPSTVDVGKIKSIVIWCKLAGIAFGGAVLK
jgi:hypothetical protein